MHRNALLSLPLLALAAAISALLAALPARAQRPELPPAGDCYAMTAANAGTGIWYGEFSGRYEDQFRDGFYYPVAARGCFASEYACRRWTNQLLSITGQSALMSCRPYRQVK